MVISARKTPKSQKSRKTPTARQSTAARRSTATRPSRNSQQKSRAPRLSPVQKTILAVIIVAVLAVVIATIFAFKFDRKYQIEAKIADLARTYYEDYYYPNAFGDDSAKAAQFLQQFTATGTAPVNLRQLLLSTPGVTDEDKTVLRQYCDQNRTSVIYLPESPFARDSYHIDYTYSCNFD